MALTGPETFPEFDRVSLASLNTINPLLWAVRPLLALISPGIQSIGAQFCTGHDLGHYWPEALVGMGFPDVLISTLAKMAN